MRVCQTEGMLVSLLHNCIVSKEVTLNCVAVDTTVTERSEISHKI
jgi:hypothetical protein